MKSLKAVVFCIGWVVASTVGAHGGALDSYGCHPNIAHGSYHCHTGPLADRQFRNRAEMLQAFNEVEQRAQPKPKLLPSGYRH